MNECSGWLRSHLGGAGLGGGRGQRLRDEGDTKTRDLPVSQIGKKMPAWGTQTATRRQGAGTALGRRAGRGYWRDVLASSCAGAGAGGPRSRDEKRRR